MFTKMANLDLNKYKTPKIQKDAPGSEKFEELKIKWDGSKLIEEDTGNEITGEFLDSINKNENQNVKISIADMDTLKHIQEKIRYFNRKQSSIMDNKVEAAPQDIEALRELSTRLSDDYLKNEINDLIDKCEVKQDGDLFLDYNPDDENTNSVDFIDNIEDYTV